MAVIIGGYRLGTLLRRTGAEILEDNVLGLAAQTAYYFFFSLFPILLFITPLLGMLVDAHAAIAWVEQQLGRAVPPESFALLRGVIEDVVLSENAPGFASIGALLALWAGSNVFNTLAGALNRAFDIEEDRPWWKTRLIAIAMVLLSGLVLGVGFVTLLAGRQIIEFVAGMLNLSSEVELFWTIAQYTLTIVLLVTFAFLTFYFLPNTRQHK